MIAAPFDEVGGLVAQSPEEEHAVLQRLQ